MTLDYKTSKGDWGEASLGYLVEGSYPGRGMPVVTSRLSRRPSKLRTSTTLVCPQGQLKAGGTRYDFVFSVQARDEGGDGNATASGTKATLVIEMRSSGP